MASTNLGKVTMTPKGEYAPEATYNRLDLVRFQGSSFVVLKDGVAGVTPSDDGQQYSLLAQKGDSGEQGAVGEMGPQGEQGLQGESGVQGVPGEKGEKGERGEKGEKGENGENGFSPTVQTTPAEGGTTVTITDQEGAKSFTVKHGAKGDKGERGETGAPGQKGEAGARGAQGERGRDFTIIGSYESKEALQQAVTSPKAGDAYAVGAAAPYDIYIYDSVTSGWTNHGKLQGAKGEKGDAGAKGEPGLPGAKGERGEPGAPGQNGTPGERGEPGEKGTDGFSPTVQTTQVEGGWTITITDHEGEKSFTVKDGAKGERGEPGQTGAKGERGEPGQTGAKGERGEPGQTGAKGERGEPGAPGAKGDAGQSASLRIGTVQTGQAGTQAQVTNSGTSIDAVFDFIIPRGEKGDRGEPGAKGDRGDPGPQGASGARGAQGEAGKNAYQSAQSGGFSGSESTFNSNLAQVGNKINKPSSATNGQVLTYSNGNWIASNSNSGALNVVTGSYVGNFEQLSIRLGKRPKAVFISANSMNQELFYRGLQVGSSSQNCPIQITSDGFTLISYRNYDDKGMNVNQYNVTYNYIALL